MKLSTLLAKFFKWKLPLAIFACLFLLPVAFNISTAQTASCEIVITGCPPAEISNPYCADEQQNSVWGKTVTWTAPTFSPTCLGTGGFLYFNTFDIPANKIAAGCWTFNHVARVGTQGGNLRPWQSSGTGNPFFRTPYFYFSNAPATAEFSFSSDVTFDIQISFIDNLGNATLSQIVTIIPGNDVIYPITLTAPSSGSYAIKFDFVNTTGFGEAGASINMQHFGINAIVLGGCSGDANFTVETNHLPGEFFPIGTTEVIYKAILRDDAGNVVLEKSCNFDIVVAGSQPIITCPPNVQPSYTADPGVCTALLSFVATADADCGDDPIVSYNIGAQPITFPYQFPVGNTTVTAVATGFAGLNAECNFNVVVVDSEDPSVTCAASSVQVPANNNCMASVPNIIATATISDNCTPSGSLTITQSPAANTMVGLGSHAITITARDAAGNSNTCTTSFVVTDNTDPVVTCPASLSPASANGSCMAPIPNVVALSTINDNCTTRGSLSIVQNPVAGTMVGLGDHNIEIVVRDEAGNQNSCNTTFTVEDNSNPSVSCGNPLAPVSANANCNALIPDVIAQSTISDGCSNTNESLLISQSPTAGTTVSVGTYEITVTATDASGNSSSCKINFIVRDNTIPSVTCAASSVQVPANNNCMASVPNIIATATISDNCTPRGSLTVTQLPAANTMVGLGTHVITITARDAAGNSNTCTTSFVVTDDTDPVVTCPASLSPASANGSCMAPIPNVVALSTINDNCTTKGNLSIVQNPVAGTMVGLGDHNIEIVVRDEAGNQNSCNTTFTVEDNSNPSVSCGNPLAPVSANANCNALIPDVIAQSTISDGCSNTPESLRITQSPTAGTTVSIGSHQITVTATDASGNSSSCNIQFIVRDNTIPSVACAASTVQASANVNCMATVPNIIATATISDNCTPRGSLTVTQLPVANTMVGLGTHVITITARDAAGNSNTCTTSFVVTDNTDPVVSCGATPASASANMNCRAAIPNVLLNATFDDNCTDNVNLLKVQVPAAGTMVGLGTHPITITVTDESGNQGSCSTSFTVTDNSSPIIACNQSTIELQVDANCTANAPSLQQTAIYSDNCASNFTFTQVPAVGTPLPLGKHSITLTIRDGNGNEASCVSNVEVVDNRIASIVCEERDHRILNNGNCDGVMVTLTPPTVSGNCILSNIGVTAVRSDGKPLNAYYPIGTTTVTWTGRDGNVVIGTCSQDVIITEGYLLVNYWFENALTSDYPIPADETYTGVSSSVGTDVLTLIDGVKVQNPGAETTENAFKYNYSRDPALEMTNSREPGFKYFQFVVSGAELSEFYGYHVYFQAERLPKGAVSVALEYSIDGISFTNIGNLPLPIQNVPYEASFDLTNVSALYGIDMFYLRLRPVGDEVTPNSLRMKVDNFQIKADSHSFEVICPADATVYTLPGLCSQTYVAAIPTVIGTCTYILSSVRSDGMTMSSPYPTGTTTITHSATNNFGVVESCTQNVNVIPVPLAIDDSYSFGILAPGADIIAGNALENDLFNCGMADIGEVVVFVVEPASNPGIQLDPATGNVIVSTTTPSGIYVIEYKICAIANPTLCSNAIITITIDRDLPVVGLKLIAVKSGENVELKWKTISEQNTSHFVVEKSLDGKNWIPISQNSKVPSVGNSTIEQKYSARDLSKNSSIVFYRVRLVDKDGSVKSSNIVAVRFGQSTKVKVFPNPFAGYIVLELPKQGKYKIEIYNAVGQLVMEKKNIEILGAIQTITLVTDQLSAGNYNIKVVDYSNNSVQTIRAIKFNK